MGVQGVTIERRARQRRIERGRRPGAVAVTEPADDHDEHEAPVSARTMPRIVTVYRGAASGEFRHTRCHHELTFVGVRGGIEIDFYCLACREHITLTESALGRVPVGLGS